MATTVHPRPSRTRSARPGWPEAIAAAVLYALGYAILPKAAIALTQGEPVVRGLTLAALSGILGLIAFAAARLVRFRRPQSFGLGGTSWRWVLVAVACGVGALILTRLASVVYVLLGGDVAADPQGDYRAAASGGVVALVLQLLFIAVLTPIGEEFAFRAVLTNALARSGAVLSVIASTVVFALAHGINLALIPAVVVGAVNAVLFLKSGSVWPGVIVHAVNNGVGTALPLLLS